MERIRVACGAQGADRSDSVVGQAGDPVRILTVGVPVSEPETAEEIRIRKREPAALKSVQSQLGLRQIPSRGSCELHRFRIDAAFRKKFRYDGQTACSVVCENDDFRLRCGNGVRYSRNCIYDSFTRERVRSSPREYGSGTVLALFRRLRARHCQLPFRDRL